MERVHCILGPDKRYFLALRIEGNDVKPKPSLNEALNECAVVSWPHFDFITFARIAQTQVHINGVGKVNFVQKHDVRSYFPFVNIVCHELCHAEDHVVLLLLNFYHRFKITLGKLRFDNLLFGFRIFAWGYRWPSRLL